MGSGQAWHGRLASLAALLLLREREAVPPFATKPTLPLGLVAVIVGEVGEAMLGEVACPAPRAGEGFRPALGVLGAAARFEVMPAPPPAASGAAAAASGAVTKPLGWTGHRLAPSAWLPAWGTSSNLVGSMCAIAASKHSAGEQGKGDVKSDRNHVVNCGACLHAAGGLRCIGVQQLQPNLFVSQMPTDRKGRTPPKALTDS